MVRLKMSTFHKRVNCPSSEKLLAFQNGEISAGERDKITVHLRFCEFCAAEVELYAHYPQDEGNVEKTEIPLPLYELAESILKKKKIEDSLVDKTLDEDEFDY